MSLKEANKLFMIVDSFSGLLSAETHPELALRNRGAFMKAAACDPLGTSILKWEYLVAQLKKGTHIYDCGSCNTCACCAFYVQSSGSCHECPICEYSGYPRCENTPYEEWSTADHKTSLLKFLELAKNELSFLRKVQKRIKEQET